MNRKSSIAIFIISVFFILREYIPFIAYNTPTAIDVSALSLAYILLLKELRFENIKKYILLFSVPVVNSIVSQFFVLDYNISENIYRLMQMFFWALMCEYICRNDSIKFSKYIYVIVITSIIITCITTYQGHLLITNISRFLTARSDDLQFRLMCAMLNIGGFDFVYNLVLLLPFVIFNVKYIHSSILGKVIAALLACLMFMTIYISSFSMAIIFSSLSLFIFILPSKLNVKKSVGIIFVTAIVIISLIDIFPKIFAELSEFVESEDVSMRMEELSDITSGRETSGDGQDRMNNYSISYENFINNFLTGSGNKSGGHSFVLDTMALYGIWGLILIVIQFAALFRITIFPHLKSEYSTIFIFVYILHFFVCLSNPHFFYNVFILFMPLYIRFHERTKSVILGRKTIK